MTAPGTTQVEIISAETSIVTLHGEHDLASTGQLTVALAVAARCPNILVDVSDSDFIDSSVISAFLRAAGKARQRDGALSSSYRAAASRGAPSISRAWRPF